MSKSKLDRNGQTLRGREWLMKTISQKVMHIQVAIERVGFCRWNVSSIHDSRDKEASNGSWRAMRVVECLLTTSPWAGSRSVCCEMLVYQSLSYQSFSPGCCARTLPQADERFASYWAMPQRHNDIGKGVAKPRMATARREAPQRWGR